MKRALDFRKEDINSLILKLAVPSFLGIVINLLYGFVDGIFIGRGVGTDALGGVTVVFPLTLIVISFASLIGEGLASVVARKVAEGDRDHVVEAVRTGHTAALLISVMLIIMSTINLDGLMSLLGSTTSILGYAKEYYGALLWGLPFMSVSLVYFHQLNAQGAAKQAMKAMALSTFMNIILDYLAIYVLNMGVAGAAYATVASQILWYSYMHFHALRDAHIITVKRSVSLKLHTDKLVEIAALGFSSFIRQIGVSVAMILINTMASQYGTSTHIAAFGATQRIFRLMIAPVSAISLAFKPIVGQNFGFKEFERVRVTVRTSLRWSFGIGLALLLGIVLLRDAFGVMFGMSHAEQEIFNGVLLLTTCLFPLYGVHHLAVAYFTAIGKPKQALGLNVLKQVLLLIPLVLILPRLFGVLGLFAALPLADAISIGFALVMMKRDLDRLNGADYRAFRV